ncbi:MAG: endonuclease/exonuclease/phosphatase family protein [Candidatus Eisenbacteria bacterium]|nr:endonuclease/exonuclease/phosphatase family protein [Candidatus Eisenbacteria bacterium]
MTPRSLLSIAVTALLALATQPRLSAAAAADTLIVVTLNLWHDSHDWPRRLAVILPELRRIRPDVLLLQEVLQHATLRNQAETLADSLGCHVQFASVDGPERPKRYGNAVLTPHRILLRGERNLSPDNDYRAVAHVRLEWRGHQVDAYSTHLHHTPDGGEIRATQIRHLLAYVDSTRGKGPVLIGGDFNCELGSPEMNLMTARWLDVYRAVHPGASRAAATTFNPLYGPEVGVIDHLFVEARPARRVKPVASEVIFRTATPDSVWASDHFGVVGKVTIAR